MEYLFRLPDGRRLALWSERNQIVRMVSGGGNRSQNVIRSDFLSDLVAAMYDGKIYFVYQNTASMVMLHLPDDEEDILLFGERLESCRHGGLTLFPWQGKLYLFYTAWNSVREKYALKLRELPLNRVAGGASDGIADRAESGPGSVAADNGARPEVELLRELETEPVFQVLAEENALYVLFWEGSLKLMRAENGEEHWERGKWISQEQIRELESGISELQQEKGNCRDRITELQQERDILQNRIIELRSANRLLDGQRQSAESRLASAIDQYNKLAELTRQLQQEGKKWRDRYYQETRKNERTGAMKVKRISETQS